MKLSKEFNQVSATQDPEIPGTLGRILSRVSPAKRQQIDEDIELAARQAIAREDKATVTITLELVPSEEGTHVDFTLYSSPKIPRSAAAIVRAIQASGLTREEYAERMHSRDEAANAVLAEALAALTRTGVGLRQQDQRTGEGEHCAEPQQRQGAPHLTRTHVAPCIVVS